MTLETVVTETQMTWSASGREFLHVHSVHLDDRPLAWVGVGVPYLAFAGELLHGRFYFRASVSVMTATRVTTISTPTGLMDNLGPLTAVCGFW